MSDQDALDKIVPSNDEKESLERRVSKYHETLFSEKGKVALDYLKNRGLDESTLRHFKVGLVLSPEPVDAEMDGRISIPFATLNGYRCIRFRLLGEGKPKYLQGHGTRAGLFNTNVIADGGEELVICEGEFDAMTLHQIGLKAVAYPGAQYIKEWHERLFEGYTRVFLCGDGDKAGKEFNMKMASMVPGPISISLPESKDISDIYKESGRKGVLKLLGKD